MKRAVPAILIGILYVSTLRAQPPVESLDYLTIAKIRDEGLNRSQVMDHISWLSDVYGPRLTGSPAILQASDWVLKQFKEWGLVNAHRETWPFGKGWALVRFSAHLIEPQVQPLIGFPGSWTPGTNGTITASVVRVQIDSDADFEKYRGKLAGKIVLTQPEREVPMLEGPIVHRMSEADLAEAATTPIPRGGGGRAGRGRGVDPSTNDEGRGRGAAVAFANKTAAFLKAEGVVAVFNRGSDTIMYSVGSDLSAEQQRTDGGTIFPTGNGSRGGDAGSGLPTVTLAVEHYNRMVRVLAKGIPVKVELNIETKFFDESTPNGFNTIAEIPGNDPVLKDEVVMLGAHFDSVAAATGATDNAAGSGAMMEAMRILKAVGARPRRTIRVALWGGEEEGLLGSRAYVREHFGDPATMALKPEHAKLAAYFNSDNGTGRVRGIWLQGNLDAGAIFEQWMKPLADLGVVAAGPRSVTSTDHVSFDAVGLPGFQFMVDRLEYNSRTHHSNMDVYDRVQRDDMVQQATVVAVFAYDAAMRDEKLPRKALPTVQ
ncbi:MAG: M20/M25/M40 family metallo-hydrolase [Acidobacteria bacterium]|nr:M20/M25/M40 family metallo-hydrolase [Acidobacteriota bacterium]